MNTSAKVYSNDPVPILIAGDKGQIDGLKLIASYAKKIIEFYIDLFGFYPHKYLLIIPGSESSMGGFPVDTGIIKIHSLEKIDDTDWWHWITAHEIGHMYWGFYVYDGETVEEEMLGWLTLGLGLYTDMLYRDAFNIKTEFHENIINSYQRLRDQGKTTVFGLTQKEMDELDFDYNTSILHGKSYSIIKRISEEIGNDVFLDFMIHILDNYKNKKLTFHSFIKSLKNRNVQILFGEVMQKVEKELEE